MRVHGGGIEIERGSDEGVFLIKECLVLHGLEGLGVLVHRKNAATELRAKVMREQASATDRGVVWQRKREKNLSTVIGLTRGVTS